MKDALEI